LTAKGYKANKGNKGTMRTIAIVNEKGGSGKTTTAVNLAAALAEKGRKVLLLDLDPQAHGSLWYGIREGGRGLLDALAGVGGLKALVLETKVPGVSLIPSSMALATAEKALAGEVGAETVLRGKVETLGDGLDYLLMDCPPSLGILTVNALAAAREVIVPVEAGVLALNGLAALMRTVDVVKQRLNHALELAGIVACRVDMRTRLSQEVIERLRSTFAGKVYKSIIRENVRLAEAPSYAQPITQYDTHSHGAEDYRALAAEVIKQEGRA